MVKTYRALGVVALVSLLGLALYAAYLHWLPTSYPNPGSGLLDLLAYWRFTVPLFAPIVSTFAVIVAAQSRDRPWLLVMLIVGFVGWYGELILPPLLNAVGLGAAMPSSYALLIYTYGQTAFWALPALVALVFVWRKLRAIAPTAQAS